MQRQAARVPDDAGERAAVFSSSSPFFRNRRTFFLLCIVNRLKIVLTLTFYPFFPVNFNVFSIFPLDAAVSHFPIFPIPSILTAVNVSLQIRRAPNKEAQTSPRLSLEQR